MIIDRRDIDFLLYEWLGLDDLLIRERFNDHSPETVDALLDLGDHLATTTFLTHYKDADCHEPELVDGKVHVLPAIRKALVEYAKAGLFGSAFDAVLGGWQLPQLVHLASLAQFMAANVSTTAYVMLTVANARLIAKFGTTEQIEVFAKAEIEGQTLGTMCLSEPQAGSGLGDIRTRAVEDGEDRLGKRFRLFGNKMWISGS
jgi:alkylation response protein AidB-like acyl-CoA dehydrogenase